MKATPISQLLAIVLACGGLLSGQARTGHAQRPNVLLICVDDLKPLLGCYGDKAVKSPHIDRLAARGLRFDAAYCNQAVCSPSRNALLVGLRSQTLGIYDLGTNFRRARPDAVTLPQYFKAHGYHTAALGKIFHVGHGNHDDERSWSVPHWTAGGRATAGINPLAKAKQGKRGKAKNRPRGPAVESADVDDDTYADGLVAKEAVRRLEEATKTPDQPFFLAVGFVKPHLPFVAPKKYWELYDQFQFEPAANQSPPDGAPPFAPTTWGELRQYQGIPKSGELPAELQRQLIHGYHAATSYMDAQVGRLLDALDTLNLAQNTIIVLWGDHGWHLGDHGMWCKHTNYEQAARIPLVIVAPGVTRPDTTTAALVESVDVYPTLAALAGLPAPEGLDGTSLVPVLRDPAASVKDFILHVYPRQSMIGRAVRTSRHRLVEWKEPGADANSASLELYDYERDPAERKNLLAEQPEAVAKLRGLLAGQPEAQPQLRLAADAQAKP